MSPSRGGSPRRAPSHSLFFAIFPPTTAAALFTAAAERLRSEHRLSNRLIAPDRLHVTLCALSSGPSEPSPAIIDLARSAAATITSPCFDVVFDRALSFGRAAASTHPLVLQGDDEGVAALTVFHRHLVTALAEHGLQVPLAFSPHMTLLYGSRHVAQQPIDPLCWTATALTLVHSHVGATRHEHLGSWPLRPLLSPD